VLPGLLAVQFIHMNIEAALFLRGDVRPDNWMTPATCRAARNLLGLTQDELARQAGIAALTLRQYENGTTKRPSHDTWLKIKRALERSGVMFIDADKNGGPGLRLRKADEE
jgi:transcriptional regulator with XRE-family HTH domain